jgi:tagatose-6-phosphate ketose/aldose isomerase
MPAASCDRGFAMTSSFTCMLLAALSVLDPGPTARLEMLAQLGEVPGAAGLRPWRLARSRYSACSIWAAARWKRWQGSRTEILELTGGALSVAIVRWASATARKPPSTAKRWWSAAQRIRLARRYEGDLLEELQRDQRGAACLTMGSGGDFGRCAGLARRLAGAAVAADGAAICAASVGAAAAASR